MASKCRKSCKIIWKSWWFSILVAVLVATSFKSAIADWNVVPTGSMLPTIVEGDRIFINKLAYDLKIPYTTRHLLTWANPERGDIVVLYSPVDNTRLVKRVIGLPGETLAMHNNRLYINGRETGYALPANLPINANTRQVPAYTLREELPGRHHPVRITPGSYAPRSFAPLTIPEGHYFVMGDNRDNSADSRYFGFVRRERIVGEALAVVISLDIFNWYKPRWERSFTRLP
jgi:signal peptidase I